MAERRRVLLVIDSMEVGGSQRQIHQLIEGLDRTQWDPELAFFRTDSFLAELVRKTGIPVHFLPKRGRVDLRFVLSLARLLRGRNYAVVHAYSLTAEVWTLVVKWLCGLRCPVVASERSAARADRPAWFWLVKRLALSRSSAVIANSEVGARSTAQRTGVDEDKFTTIANAVEVPEPLARDHQADLRQSLCIQDGKLTALFVGRMVDVKNLPCLVKALSLIPSDSRPLTLLVGEGPAIPSIQGLARNLGVESDVHFVGARDDVSDLMQVVDYLVLPSHFEGQSNALLEAMAAGCPVIASAVGGNIELIDHESSGFLFPDDDAQALAHAMRRMEDPRVRCKLACKALGNVVTRHSRSALAAATADVYRRCLAEGNQPAGRMPIRMGHSG
ncbi:hypothetical protein N800_08655 [Lysobacter daejeonensis GH1-9]|uniref:Glycosyltransferase subfamily 4-like N-terminal domain-containing protein n=1 Tax=Lysobacter daejeonensis GH1-9 TaxID=1385517 RepID=A0A0A0F4E5_9GAMM|nr:glycosyltransferase [Lysobacter daejeonensis]KGM56262.1 hypothetical protein N800_08655 [Lysobacter daejeonensis GH1-9]